MTSSTRPVAVVTGGRQGLGLAAAQALASQGFDVAVIDLHAPDETSDGVLADLTERGASARYYALDISDIDKHKETIDAIWNDFGRLDCLHNNAGIAARPLTDVLELSAEAFDRAVDINLRGSFFLSQEVARRMVADDTRHEDGIYRSIIFVTSIAAELVSVDRAQYNITKAGLSMVAKLLAVRLGAEGIAVHEVRPGFMATNMTQSAGAGTSVIDQWIAEGRVPINRWGSPQDVGTAVASLASGSLPYTTGQPFWVAGGLNIPQAT